MVFFIFDVETTGLPKGRNKSFKDLECYENCRIVSISWNILEKYDERAVKKQHYIVYPESWTVPISAERIHGISTAMAMEQGIKIAEICKQIEMDVEKYKCDTLVAHNISFDFKALMSELHRANNTRLMSKIFGLKRYCTMLNGQKFFKLKKWPKLSVLYEMVTNKQLENAHRSDIDTDACQICFKEIYFLTSSESIN